MESFLLLLLPRGWDLGLEAGGRGGAGKKKEEEEKIPNMCESIGHRPLRDRCLKGEGIVAKALDGQRYPCPA